MRPYILTLNSSVTTDLWQMANAACGITNGNWHQAVQQTSLLPLAPLPRDYRGAAKRRGEFLAPLIHDRTVVLIGSDVASAIGHELSPLVWAPDRDFVMIPHPSATWHKHPVHRLAAGILLADILKPLNGGVYWRVT